MEHKTARLTLLIDPNKKEAFERLCARQDRTASQVVRQLIREYLAQHGVEYEAAGPADESLQAAVASRRNAASAKPKAAATSAAASAASPRPRRR